MCNEEEKIQRLLEKADLPKGGLMLDVSTGKGGMVSTLARNGHMVITLDEKPELQIEAELRVQRLGLSHMVEFDVERVESLSFDSESFDGVVLFQALDRVANIEAGIMKMIDVCKIEGKLLIVELTRLGLELLQPNHTSNVVDLVPVLNSMHLDYQLYEEELRTMYVFTKK